MIKNKLCKNKSYNVLDYRGKFIKLYRYHEVFKTINGHTNNILNTFTALVNLSESTMSIYK